MPEPRPQSLDVELSPRPDSVARARAVTRDFLRAAEPSFRDRDAAVLVVSELVTNALVHTREGEETIRLHLEVSHGRLRVEVVDHGSAQPRSQPAAPDAPGGRGLPLVARLAGEWRWAAVAGAGKRVWCELGPESSGDEEG